jgi:chromosome segregation ATPase
LVSAFVRNNLRYLSEMTDGKSAWLEQLSKIERRCEELARDNEQFKKSIWDIQCRLSEMDREIEAADIRISDVEESAALNDARISTLADKVELVEEGISASKARAEPHAEQASTPRKKFRPIKSGFALPGGGYITIDW